MAPKPCEVLQRFIAKLNGTMANIVVIIVQSGFKLYDLTILAAGVEKEQVCSPFAQRSHHVRV